MRRSKMNGKLAWGVVSRPALALCVAWAGWAAVWAWPAGDARIAERPAPANTWQGDAPATTIVPSQSDAPASKEPWSIAPARRLRATPGADSQIQLCEALGPASPYAIQGLDCADGKCGEQGWGAARPINWQSYAQGEYVGHQRTAHVDSYLLRVDDELEFVFRLTREETSRPYQLNVGDEIRVESFTDEKLDRDLAIQPDGTITLRLLGQVRATLRSVDQLRQELEERYKKFYKTPAITVTPLKVNTRLEDLRATVDSRMGFGGQSRRAKVTPEGTIQLPLVGSVPAQGLTLDELKRELDERYATAKIEGFEATPVLATRAPRYVYVLGEVKLPGRYELVGPTTAMQAISLAGGWNYGGNLWKTVVFRRGDDWRLMATMLDLRGALYGKRPCPADEIWLNDSDIVLVPKTRLLVSNNVIDMLFTHGLWGIVPFSTSTSFSITKFSALP
ncbi:MAG TPA: polysaccharide biosynthesis/export family protein [Pirellulales bacterium]|nr:polysaccharide biosynthesis/export family protein [Pirellulales bacterium]